MATGKVKGFDNSGLGLTEEGLSLRFAYPGDLVEFDILSKKKKIAKLSAVIEPATVRTPPQCRYFGDCGGCLWQGLKYSEQLKYKEKRVRELFGDCRPIIPSPHEYFYRNRMDYAFGPDFSLGLKPDRRRVLDIQKCWLMSESSNQVIAMVRKYIQEKQLLTFPDGPLRHLVIREGESRILNIIIGEGKEFPLEELWGEVKSEVQGITMSVNRSPADRSYGEVLATIGQDHYLETLNGIKFKVPIQSFFQTNTFQAEELIKTVIRLADLERGERVYDLYSGTGSFGLSLAAAASQVVGLEENEPAAKLSLENANLNKIDNYSVLIGRAEEIVKNENLKADVVVLDPPRAGIHRRVAEKIALAKPPKIVYVSCNPVSQKKDIDILLAAGYLIKEVQPMDMFPQTPHIENVVLLAGSARQGPKVQ